MMNEMEFVFSLYDLLISFLVSIGFVIIFKIQKAAFPHIYYSASELFLSKSITYKQVVIRMIIIFVYSSLLHMILTPENIVLGVLVGALLITWPAFLHPTEMMWGYHYLTYKEKLIYFLFLLSFIIISPLLAYVGLNVNFEDLINKVIDSWIFGLIILMSGLQEKTANMLSENIRIRSIEVFEDYEDELESEASEEENSFKEPQDDD